MDTPVKNLTEMLGEDFAASILTRISKFDDSKRGFAPNVTVIIGKVREERRDAALAILQEHRGDIYRDRTVVISEHPAEIPARPPKKDATMEEYTYAPALFSVTPASSELPDEQVIDEITGQVTLMTRLERTLKDFSRWDIDFYIVLASMDSRAWQALVHLSLVGICMFAGAERDETGAIHVGEGGIKAFQMLGAAEAEHSNATFIDLDQKKVFRTLAEANIVA